MSCYQFSFLIVMTGLMGSNAFANQLEEQDPVRVAKRLEDCVTHNLALHDGRTDSEIRRACRKAVADGSYNDPNISLDGMINTHPQK